MDTREQDEREAWRDQCELREKKRLEDAKVRHATVWMLAACIVILGSMALTSLELVHGRLAHLTAEAIIAVAMLLALALIGTFYD